MTTPVNTNNPHGPLQVTYDDDKEKDDDVSVRSSVTDTVIPSRNGQLHLHTELRHAWSQVIGFGFDPQGRSFAPPDVPVSLEGSTPANDHPEVVDAQDNLLAVLRNVAASPEEFQSFLKTAFGDDVDPAAAEALRQRIIEGDVDWLPSVNVLAKGQSVEGAYADGEVYINEDVLKHPDVLREVLAEQVGHHLSEQLGVPDPKGGNGEIFRRMVQGEALTAREIEELRTAGNLSPREGGGEIKAFDQDVKFDRLLENLSPELRSAARELYELTDQSGPAVRDEVSTFVQRLDAGNFESALRGLAEILPQISPPKAINKVWSAVANTLHASARELVQDQPEAVKAAVDQFFSKLDEQSIDEKTLANSVFPGVADFMEGLKAVAGGRAEAGLSRMLDGITQLSGAGDEAVESASKLVETLSTALGLEEPGRPLTAEEQRLQARLFGFRKSPADIVKVGFPPHIAERAGDADVVVVPPGDTIYVRNEDVLKDESNLAQALMTGWHLRRNNLDPATHWDNLNQAPSGNDWIKDAESGVPFKDLAPAAQTALIVEAHRQGFFGPVKDRPDAFIVDGQDFTEYLDDAKKTLIPFRRLTEKIDPPLVNLPG